jgi:hypothetical protein
MTKMQLLIPLTNTYVPEVFFQRISGNLDLRGISRDNEQAACPFMCGRTLKKGDKSGLASARAGFLRLVNRLTVRVGPLGLVEARTALKPRKSVRTGDGFSGASARDRSWPSRSLAIPALARCVSALPLSSKPLRMRAMLAKERGALAASLHQTA